MKVLSGLAEHCSLVDTLKIQRVVTHFASVLINLKLNIYVFVWL